MVKKVVLLALVVAIGVGNSTFANVKKGDWIGSVGTGITADPSTFLISPQAEYVFRPNLFFGPMVQVGFGSGGTLYTGSATARLVFGRHPAMRPNLEAGAGLAAASSIFASTIGLHLHFGVGFDYVISPTMSLGTTFRANFAPPLKSFFLSWPVLILRTSL